MSAVAQSLKKPFKTPWSPPATQKRKERKKYYNTIVFCGKSVVNSYNILTYYTDQE